MPSSQHEGLASFTGSDALLAVESGVRRCDAAELVDAPTSCRISNSGLGLQPRRLAHAARRTLPLVERQINADSTTFFGEGCLNLIVR